MWVLHLLQVVVLLIVDFPEGEVLVIDADTLPEDAFLLEFVGVLSEVVDHNFKDLWYSPLTLVL